MTIEELYHIYKEHPVVETDSRKLTEGCVFFALKGANFDGNQYAKEALEKGASYAVVDDESVQGEGIILVEDTLEALQDLASYHREQLGIPLIAITGTNGKTTTKELTAEVLKKSYNLLYTEGNLNNHIGVPLTLLKMTEEHQLALIEMGASKQGDIAELCAIAQPNYGLITNIGLAHLEGFGSLAGVKATKGELFDYLKKHEGIVFFNEEDKMLSAMAKGIPSLSYGSRKEATVRSAQVKDDLMLSFEWFVPALKLNNVEQKTNLVGAYNLDNCLAAISIGLYFDVKAEDICQAIADYKPTNSRSQFIESEKGNKIIADAYNANPTSMSLAIDNFFKISEGKSRVFILGEMKELGEAREEAHQKIYDKVLKTKEAGDFVILYGSAWLGLKPVLNEEMKQNSNPNFRDAITVMMPLSLKALIEWVERYKNTYILVKGSNSMGLNKVLPYL